MNWHYVDQGKQTGPVTGEQLAELFRAGKIEAGTLVWCAGMADWIPYGETIAGSKPDQPPVSPAPPVAGTNEAVCAECHKIFPADEMIRHGAAYICAGCKPVFMQKLSEGAPVLAAGELRYATVLTRFAAVFLDGLILGAVNFGIGLISSLTMAHPAGTQPKGAFAFQAILFTIEIAIALSYETIMVGKYGATLGKMACKIQVVTADGGRVSYGRAAGRYFGKMLSSFTCLIGYIMAFFDKPQNRALHDRICNTRVIQK